MAFEDNELLFGADKTPRIVAIELGETGTVRVYRREKNGSTAVDAEPFHPFVWTDGDITDLGLENAQKLTGDLRYNWLVTVDSWKELIALRNGLKKAGRSFFALSDPVQHYLSASGRTLFKKLPFGEVKPVPLEVLSPTGERHPAGSFAPARRVCKSRRKPSIIQSSRSMVATSSILFYSPSSMTSACAPSAVSSALMSRSTSAFAIRRRFRRSMARPFSANISGKANVSGNALCALFEKLVPWLTC